MWVGVTNGFAGMKFSASPKEYGAIRQIKATAQSILVTPIRSLIV